MDEVSFPQDKVRVKVEEPDEIVSHEEQGSVEPVPKRTKTAWWNHEPTEEEKRFERHLLKNWEPKTAAQEKSAELRAIYEKDRVVFEYGVKWHRTERETFELLRESFFDSKWFRSVYWDERSLQYESRTFDPVAWEAPEGWTAETLAEFNQRRRFWKDDGTRLEHEDAIVGAKYELYEHPEHLLVCVVAINEGKLPPKVLVKLEGTDRAWWVFTDELDRKVWNSKRNIKNWQRHRRASYYASGTTIWDTITETEGPPDEHKTPSFPAYRLATTA